MSEPSRVQIDGHTALIVAGLAGGLVFGAPAFVLAVVNSTSGYKTLDALLVIAGIMGGVVAMLPAFANRGLGRARDVDSIAAAVGAFVVVFGALTLIGTLIGPHAIP